MIERIITGMAMATLFLLSLWLLSPIAWLGLMSLLLIPAATEWRRISASTTAAAQLIVSGLILLVLAVVFTPFFYLLLFAQITVTALASVAIVQGRIYPLIEKSSTVVKDFAFLIVMVSTLSAFYRLPIAFGLSHFAGVVFLLGIVSFADSGAYFVGRFFGQRPLAPSVSPKKTWEGFAGGLVAALAWALLWYALVAPASISLGLLIGVSLIGAAWSVLGDLTQSAFKRSSNVKDSGTLLPGHGGVLDRLDGVIAAVPLMALLLLVFARC